MRTMRIFTWVVAIVLAANIAWAAGDAAPLTGVALDSSGGALPGVTVTLTPTTAAAEPLVQVTDETGRFTFDQLEPGPYRLELALDGFENQEQPVSAPANSEVRVVLKIASLAETVIVHAVADDIPVIARTGETQMADKTLAVVPLANDRFEDALPLLPGTVRGPDGLLNMNGARADQSAVLMNGINMTDPVTGHTAVRLPLEAIESLTVHTGAFSSAYGSATGGVTDLVIRSGQDKPEFQVQNFLPRLRYVDGGIHGIDAFTPRLRVSGPIQAGRLWFAESLSYRFVRTRVNEIEPLEASEQKVTSLDSVTQIDFAPSASHHVSGTFVMFPSNVDNAGLDTLHPIDATPDLTQRGWTAAVADRLVLGPSSTLSTTMAVKAYNMDVAPKHDGPAVVTVSGLAGNYFNRFDRDSWRYDVGTVFATSRPSSWGSHFLQSGVQLAYTKYDGIDASQSVRMFDAAGALIRQVDFTGNPSVGASNTDVAAFVEDQWAVSDRVMLHTGLRYGHDDISSDHTLAPRVDGTVRLFGNGTVVKGGVGRLYDKLALNARDFESHESRIVTDFENGERVRTTAYQNVVADGGLQAPASTTWNVEVDQQLPAGFVARTGYRQSRGSRELVVDPREDTATLLLSSDGRSRTHEFEATLRRQFKGQSHVTASYVRSSTKGSLNDFVSVFGDLRDPILQPDAYGRRPFDVPNRFLVWGVVSLPRGVIVAPTAEYRTGFPYSQLDERQNVVGERNEGGRFPNLFTLDLAVTKDIAVMKHKARVGLQFFNLTDHFNPRDVQNNVDSPTYGDFANSVNRQVRAKFTLLF
jgi:hypothetical protein